VNYIGTNHFRHERHIHGTRTIEHNAYVHSLNYNRNEWNNFDHIGHQMHMW
jgi:hypothetical protein